MGGLGIVDHEKFGMALQLRWLWLRHTKPDSPWSSLPLQADTSLHHFFIRSLEIQVGNGNSILFWTDPWISGHSIEDLAPYLIDAVPTRTKKAQTLAQALHQRAWLKDITGPLSLPMLMDYVQIRQRVDQFVLNLEHDDVLA